MRSTVEFVIYFYLAVCALLLIFNILYIFRSKLQASAQKKRIEVWRKAIQQTGSSYLISQTDLKTLEKPEELTAFFNALSDTVLKEKDASVFFISNASQIQQLAVHYGKLSSMERAFMAYVIASFHEPGAPNAKMLSEIMLGYLEQSTVFCRENVLHALYALGSEQAVEHAFEILNEKGWYHNAKLISDGLVLFTGDKTSLAKRLFKHRMEFEDSLMVGTVQFMSSFESGEISDLLLEALDKESALSLEVRFAIVRYFQRHVREEAKPVLLELLAHDSKSAGSLSVAAASALAFYGCGTVKEALLQALHSPNWYVRRNAAMSLQKMDLTDQDVEMIRQSHDRYALEMLTYAKEVSA
ncbi:MAG: hypothetical protein J6P72_02375 [Firmicutes bacterium]|nr:hypothetical protein [Bacillota bacterium]